MRRYETMRRSLVSIQIRISFFSRVLPLIQSANRSPYRMYRLRNQSGALFNSQNRKILQSGLSTP